MKVVFKLGKGNLSLLYMTAYMIKCCSGFEKNDMVDSNDLGMQNILEAAPKKSV